MEALQPKQRCFKNIMILCLLCLSDHPLINMITGYLTSMCATLETPLKVVASNPSESENFYCKSRKSSPVYMMDLRRRLLSVTKYNYTNLPNGSDLKKTESSALAQNTTYVTLLSATHVRRAPLRVPVTSVRRTQTERTTIGACEESGDRIAGKV